MMKILLLVLVAATLLYGVVTLAVTGMVFWQSYKAFSIRKYSAIAHWDYYEDRFVRKEVRFPSGKNRLIGHFYRAKGCENIKGTIVFSHGIWSGPEEYLAWITWFAQRGWVVFAYTYTAYNGSEGKWAKGLPQSMVDLDAALSFLECEEGRKALGQVSVALQKLPIVLMGHSWGAYATAAVLTKHHPVKAAITLSGFSDPVEISVSVARSMMGPVGATMGWAVNLINRFLFGGNARVLGVSGINESHIPVLVLHGLNDGFIGYHTTGIIAHREEITNPKVSYITLEDPKQSDHNNYFCNGDATAYYNAVEADYEKQKESSPKKEVPMEQQKAFYAGVDLARANQPNEELLHKIEVFLEDSIGKNGDTNKRNKECFNENQS